MFCKKYQACEKPWIMAILAAEIKFFFILVHFFIFPNCFNMQKAI